MVLIVKLPKNKPPFIGIQFTFEHEAEKLNEDLVERFGKGTYKIVFEFLRPFTNIKLISEEHLLIRNYSHIAYEDTEKLKVWLKLTKDTPPKYFNFGHVVLVNGQHKLVKTSNKKINFVLKVDSYQALSLEGIQTKKVEVKEKTTMEERLKHRQS